MAITDLFLAQPRVVLHRISRQQCANTIYYGNANICVMRQTWSTLYYFCAILQVDKLVCFYYFGTPDDRRNLIVNLKLTNEVYRSVINQLPLSKNKATDKFFGYTSVEE